MNQTVDIIGSIVLMVVGAMAVMSTLLLFPKINNEPTVKKKHVVWLMLGGILMFISGLITFL